jgi:hypothetical protein
LSQHELIVFVGVQELWKAMIKGYQRCLMAFIEGDRQLAKYVAVLCHRCLLYSGQEISDHFRCGYEFEPKLWTDLHALYAFAEEQDFHNVNVADPLIIQQASLSCRSIYVKILLICYARPGELRRNHQQLVDKWLTQWSGVITVERSHQHTNARAPTFALDLESTQGMLPAHQVAARSSVRYLTMEPLSKLLRDNISLLEQGHTPQQVNMSGHCSSDECIELLNFLHLHLCEHLGPRLTERRPMATTAQLCFKMESIYAHLSGKPFQQPENTSSLGIEERRQIEVFGRVLHDAHKKKLMEMGFPLESWQFENESLSGARLTRESIFGGRLSNKQLIALRPSDAEVFMLGTTVWASVLLSGQLRLGLRYFPGYAEPVRVRHATLNATGAEKYVPGFLLAAVPILNSPASLIVPREWMEMVKFVEVLHQNGDAEHFKIGFSVEYGVDYERFSLTPTVY